MSRIPPPRNPPPEFHRQRRPSRSPQRQSQPPPHHRNGRGGMDVEESSNGAKPPMHLAPIQAAFDESPINGRTPEVTELLKQLKDSERLNPPPVTPPQKGGGRGGGAKPPGAAEGARGRSPGKHSLPDSGNGLGEGEDLTLIGSRQVPPKRSVGEMLLKVMDHQQQASASALGMDGRGGVPLSPPPPSSTTPSSMMTRLKPSRKEASRPPALKSSGSPPTTSGNPLNSPLLNRTSSMNRSSQSNHLSVAIHQAVGATNSNSHTNSLGSGAIPTLTTSNSNSYNTCNSTYNNSTGVSENSVLVAVRIRPFNRKEVEELQAEVERRRLNPTLTASERLASTVGRPKERQPFGPGRDDLANAVGTLSGTTKNLTVTASGEVVGNPLENCDLDMLMDDQGNPVPVMERRPDGRTLMLLDPHVHSDKSSEFSYDYVFSYFSPSIEISGIASAPNATHPPSFRMGDTVDGLYGSPTSPVPPMIAGLEVDLTPEQEEQAELEQLNIFHTLGRPLISSALEGYNACIFAYGQTSSGKTYTMMGTKEHRGLIPRICHDLFERVEQIRQNSAAGQAAVKVELAYMEIYNDQVRDLLKQRHKNTILHYNSRFDTKDVDHKEYQSLRVRMDSKKGVFVQGLTTVEAESWSDCVRCLRQGSALRTQCSTAMNATSSRSHAIFQLTLTQTDDVMGKVRGKAVTSFKCSKINLVDLAGSERNSKSESVGQYLLEANSINTSLSALRRVIEAIVTKKKIIPFRDSLLTHVLSDNFGGNSRTVMCANVSPHAVNFAETDSTLRYASIARDIRNKAKINENPTSRLIRELKDRNKGLQAELLQARTDDEKVLQLEGQLQHYHTSLENMRAREEEFHQQLGGSKEQEQKLLRALKKTQAKEELWRTEAERQKKEKEQLRSVLRTIATTNPELVKEALLSKGNNHDLHNNSLLHSSTGSSKKASSSHFKGSKGSHSHNYVYREEDHDLGVMDDMEAISVHHPQQQHGQHSSSSSSHPQPAPRELRSSHRGGGGVGRPRRGSSTASLSPLEDDPLEGPPPRRGGGGGSAVAASASPSASRPPEDPFSPLDLRQRRSTSQHSNSKHVQALRSLQNYRGIGAPLSLTGLFGASVTGSGSHQSSPLTTSSTVAAPVSAGHSKREMSSSPHTRSLEADVVVEKTSHRSPLHSTPKSSQRHRPSPPNGAELPSTSFTMEGRRGAVGPTANTVPSPSSRSQRMESFSEGGPSPRPQPPGSSSSARFHTELFMGAIRAMEERDNAHESLREGSPAPRESEGAAPRSSSGPLRRGKRRCVADPLLLLPLEEEEAEGEVGLHRSPNKKALEEETETEMLRHASPSTRRPVGGRKPGTSEPTPLPSDSSIFRRGKEASARATELQKRAKSSHQQGSGEEEEDEREALYPSLKDEPPALPATVER